MTIKTPYNNLNSLLNGGLPNEGLFFFPCRSRNGQTDFLLHTAVAASKTNKKVAFISFEEAIESNIERTVQLYSMDFLIDISKKNNLEFLHFDSSSLIDFLSTLNRLIKEGFNYFLLDGFDSRFDINEIATIFDKLYQANPSFFALLAFSFNLKNNYFRNLNDFETSDLILSKDFINKYFVFSIFSNFLELTYNSFDKIDYEDVEYFFRIYKEDSFFDSQKSKILSKEKRVV